MMVKKNITIEIIGWYGTIAIVLAYASSSLGVFSSNNVFYQILNGTGALGIVLVSFRKKTYQPAFLNIIWLIIAVVSIINILI